MAAVRFSVLKSLCNAIGPSFKLQSIRSYKSCANHTRHTDFYHLRSTYGYCNYHQGEFHSPRNIANAYVQVLGYQSPFSSKCSKTKPVTSYSSSSSILRSQNTMLVMLTSSTFGQPSHALSFSTKADKPGDLHVPGASSSSEADVSNSGLAGTDLLDKLKDAWQSAVDAVTYTGQKAKETSNELNPYVQQMLDTYPYLKNIVVPVTFTLTCTMLVWVVMPRILRRFHKYAMRGRTSLLPGDQVPYEKSFWGSLEDPVRYLVTFIAFSQMLVALISGLTDFCMFVSYFGLCIIFFVDFDVQWHDGGTYNSSITIYYSSLERGSHPFICVVSISLENKCVLSCISFTEFSRARPWKDINARQSFICWSFCYWFDGLGRGVRGGCAIYSNSWWHRRLVFVANCTKPFLLLFIYYNRKNLMIFFLSYCK